VPENSNQPKSLGQSLTELRERSHVSLRSLSQTTRIQEKYLSALEAGRYEELPDEIYVRSFVKSVTGALRDDSGPYLVKLTEELEACGKASRPGANRQIQDIPTVALTVTPTVIKRLLVGLAGAVLLLLMGLAVRVALRPPPIVLTAPEDGLVTTGATVEVAGNAEAGADLRINGVGVAPGRDGSFKETIDLHRGTNLIKITAKKRHSGEAVVYRRVVYEPIEN